ncbi:MAG: D-alanyl-D-alanine carboxypeptidase [Candidatus Kapaibacterium sp.]|nr:MAG: D-alanyl-D-alanine carboxypeptidase [Candidatus Kapabacteria bacterium]
MKKFFVYSCFVFSVILLWLFSNFSYAQKDVFSPEDSLKSINFLRKQIYQVLQRFNEDKNNYGIVVYSLDKNEYYLKHNMEKSFIPASLTKLFTTFGALSKLGKDYKVKTYVYYDGYVKKGILEGNLYIYGTGDALFSVSDLDDIVEDVKKYGIKKINGNIIADPSFFDGQTDRFIYSGDFDVVQKTQPITSIAIQKNILTIYVTAGSIYGRSVNVQVVPSSDAIKVYNSGKVSRSLGYHKHYEEFNTNSFGGGELLTQRKPTSSRNGDTKKALKVSSEVDSNGIQTIWVTGNLPAGTSRTFTYFIENPPLVVAGALKRRLETAGICVSGTFSVGNVPFDKAQPVSIVNRDLIEILKEMVKESDNYLAETVFKMIGAVDKKMTSNSKEAIRYIFYLLDSLKMPCLECKMFDGSGLSRRNRFTPEAIANLLIYFINSQNSVIIDSLLPIAGYDGTLKERMIGTTAQGKVFAKTGTHSNASGLAGFVKTLDNERLVFVFMYNGRRPYSFKKIEDELCTVLSSFFYSNIQE